MGWRFLVATSGCVLAACGIVSGLDNLTTDGGQDSAAGMDVVGDTTGNDTGSGSDASDTGTVVVDGGGMEGGLCFYTGGNPHCFSTMCTTSGTDCCVSDAGTECAMVCNAIQLACTTPDQCTDAAPNCCLSNISFTNGPSCPYVVQTVGSGNTPSFAACTSDFCQSTTKTRVCTVNSDCAGMLKCRRATFSTNPSIVLGLCL